MLLLSVPAEEASSATAAAAAASVGDEMNVDGDDVAGIRHICAVRTIRVDCVGVCV